MPLSTRPVGESDRDQLLSWRNADRVRTMSIDNRVIDRATHASWFADVLATTWPTMLIVESNDDPAGVVRLSAIDDDRRRCEWSCHLGDGTVGPGIGAGLPVISLGFGFDAWGADEMHARVLARNSNMLGVHRRMGLEPIAPTSGIESDDVVACRGRREEWPKIRERAAGLYPKRMREELAVVLDGFWLSVPYFERR